MISTYHVDVLKRCGFRDVSEPVLDLIAKDLNLDLDEKPKARFERLLWLMRKALPKVGENDLLTMLLASLHQESNLTSALAHADHRAMAEGVMDASDREDFDDFSKDEAEKAELDKASFLAFLQAAGFSKKYPKLLEKLGSTLSSMVLGIEGAEEVVDKVARQEKDNEAKGSGGKAKHLKKMLPLDLANWRKMLPEIKGCVAQLYEGQRSCQVYYPDVFPASRSRTWAKTPGEGFAREQIIRHCLMWAWTHHTKKGRGECPWDLGSPKDVGFVPPE